MVIILHCKYLALNPWLMSTTHQPADSADQSSGQHKVHRGCQVKKERVAEHFPLAWNLPRIAASETLLKSWRNLLSMQVPTRH